MTAQEKRRPELPPAVVELAPGDEAHFGALAAHPDHARWRLRDALAIEDLRTLIGSYHQHGRYGRAALPASNRPKRSTRALHRAAGRVVERIATRRVPAGWAATCMVYGRPGWEKVTQATTSWRRLVDGRPRLAPAELAALEAPERAAAARRTRHYAETASDAIDRIWYETMPVLHLVLTLYPFPLRIGYLSMDEQSALLPESARNDPERIRAACALGKHSIQDLMIRERGWLADALVLAEFWRGWILDALPEKVAELRRRGADLVRVVPAGLRE